MKGDDAAVGGGLDDAEFAGHSRGTGIAATVAWARFGLVELDHLADVHAVDVVGAEDGHHVRVGLLDQIDILKNRVGRAAIPGLARASAFAPVRG